jgi:hypothetical protein
MVSLDNSRTRTAADARIRQAPDHTHMLIAILDDESERRAEMIQSLRDTLPDAEVALFDNAPAIVAWLRERLHDVAVLSLDHDLGPNRLEDGVLLDPGTGRDVTDFLAQVAASCPVVVHTSNSHGATSMLATLELAGWHGHRVVPVNDLAWIRERWGPLVARLLSSAGAT